MLHIENMLSVFGVVSGYRLKALGMINSNGVFSTQYSKDLSDLVLDLESLVVVRIGSSTEYMFRKEQLSVGQTLAEVLFGEHYGYVIEACNLLVEDFTKVDFKALNTALDYMIQPLYMPISGDSSRSYDKARGCLYETTDVDLLYKDSVLIEGDLNAKQISKALNASDLALKPFGKKKFEILPYDPRDSIQKASGSLPGVSIKPDKGIGFIWVISINDGLVKSGLFTRNFVSKILFELVVYMSSLEKRQMQGWEKASAAQKLETKAKNDKLIAESKLYKEEDYKKQYTKNGKTVMLTDIKSIHEAYVVGMFDEVHQEIEHYYWTPGPKYRTGSLLLNGMFLERIKQTHSSKGEYIDYFVLSSGESNVGSGSYSGFQRRKDKLYVSLISESNSDSFTITISRIRKPYIEKSFSKMSSSAQVESILKSEKVDEKSIILIQDLVKGAQHYLENAK